MVNLVDIAELIEAGIVGIIPTDTVYGLVASASNKLAVKKLYDLKNREKKPGTIIASSIEQLVSLGVNDICLKRATKYWSHPISIIIPVGDSLFYLHQGVNSLAFRIVGDEKLAKLLQLTGPLMTSSANLPGEKPASSIAEAKSYFGDKVDFYVDGGDLANRQASTIIRLKKDGFEVVRQGNVSLM